MAIERRLTELIGPVAGKMHTGRSRNDQVILDLHLYLRDAVDGHQRPYRGADGGAAGAGRAAARPSSCLGTLTCSGRNRCCWPTICWPTSSLWSGNGSASRTGGERLQMPLGAGALAGVNYPLDREWVAAELGFERVAPNAMDAVAARDMAFAYLAIAASCALTLSRLAGEIVLWTTPEFGLAALPDAWTSGSSIMPQKRNPDGAELVRAKAAGFLARLQGLGGVLKGLPLAYNSDLQEDKLYVFASREELDLCLEAMTAMVEALTFDARAGRKRPRAATPRPPTWPTTWWARACPSGRRTGWPAGWWRCWPRRAGRCASATDGRTAGTQPAVRRRLLLVVDLDRVVAAKISPGGTAPQRVAEQLALAKDVLAGLRL